MKLFRRYHIFTVLLPIAVPVSFVFAVDPNLTVQKLLQSIAVELLNPIIVFLFILATLIFIWGIILYVLGAQGDGGKMQAAKSVLLWGLIGMFVMSSAWGIVNLMCNFLDTCNATIPLSPGSSSTGGTATGANQSTAGSSTQGPSTGNTAPQPPVLPPNPSIGGSGPE